jgi:hypothetical protein
MDKNNPKDLYNWYIKVRMDEPRNETEFFDCVKAILAYLVNHPRKRLDPNYKSNMEFLRKKLLLREDLAWDTDDLDRIRGIIHWELHFLTRLEQKHNKKHR